MIITVEIVVYALAILVSVLFAVWAYDTIDDDE